MRESESYAFCWKIQKVEKYKKKTIFLSFSSDISIIMDTHAWGKKLLRINFPIR